MFIRRGLWLEDSDILGRTDDGIVVSHEVRNVIKAHDLVWAYGRIIKTNRGDPEWACNVIVADGAERMTPDGPIRL